MSEAGLSTAEEQRERLAEESPVPFRGESTAKADYKAPPPGAITAPAMECRPPSLPAAIRSSFEGQSSTHHDYQPPPLEAFRQLSPCPLSAASAAHPKVPFLGGSSSHADYLAPPATAFAPVDARNFPALQSHAPELVHPQSHRETVSTAHHDYKAPGLESLRQALAQGSFEEPPSCLPRPKFEGESCAHRDFQAPANVVPVVRAPAVSAVPAVQSLLQPNGCGVGESTTHHDYRAPPLGLLNQNVCLGDDAVALPQTRFEGESTAHADYKKPPLDAMKLPLADGKMPSNLPMVDLNARFEGQSQSHCDYQPPPLEALWHTSAPAATLDSAHPKVPFLGGSSSHADYLAPPATAFAPVDARNFPALQSHAPELVHPQSHRETVSTAHHDYKAPGLESLRQALAQGGFEEPTSCLPRPKFEGESCAHRDFQAPANVVPVVRAPAVSAVPAVQSLLQPNGCGVGESTTHHDYRAPPLGLLNQNVCLGDDAVALPQTRFEGESTAHADYKKPPLDAMKLPLADGKMPSTLPMVDLNARFEGQSQSHCDYQPPPLEALLQCLKSEDKDLQEDGHGLPSATAFEGVSTFHHDFPRPPEEAYRRQSRRTGTGRRLASGLEPASRGDHPAPPLQNLWEWLNSSEQQVGTDAASIRAKAPAPDPLDMKGSHEGMHALGQAAKFEGESTAHHDYPPHQVHFGRGDGLQHDRADAEDGQPMQPRTPFEGESSMRAHYQAPPAEARKVVPADVGSRQGEMQHSSVQTARFEGESTAHRDFPAHTVPALPDVRPAFLEAGGGACKLPFDGESSMRAHYQAPPAEALRITHCDAQLRQANLQHDSVKAVKFEGESTAHSDFHAHPLEAAQRMLPSARAEEAGPAAPFEGESSMRAHYQAPPAEALKVVPADVRSRQGEMQHSSVQTARFEGESTAHRDFPAHTVPSLPDVRPAFLEAGGGACKLPFDGESSMRAHYQAPPAEALRITHCDAQLRQANLQHDSVKAVKFEGESTAHSDFHAHPLEAVQGLLPSARVEELGPAAPFEGESSMRAHYQAPPAEALKVVPADVRSRQGEMQHSSAQTGRFEGESTAHRDFPAHTAPALPDVRPAFLEAGGGACKLPFDGESSMRAHYQAPPAEALRITHCDAQLRQANLQHDSVKAVKFEGESTAHSDFHAHPLEAVQGLPSARAEELGLAAPFEGESSMRAHYQAPPAEALKVAPADVRSRQGEMQHSSAQTGRFEGESTAHRDFPAHTVPALPDVRPAFLEAGGGACKLPFDGESSMRAHYQAPPVEALRITHCDAQLRQANLQHDSVKAVKFEGESTAHSDFHAHPLEAAQRMLPSARAEELGPAAPFEGESSMRAHYQAPPAEALKVVPADVRSRQGEMQHSSAQTARFEGESTAHRDFPAHTLPALPDVRPAFLEAGGGACKLPFDGESSMRAHYQAPPVEALRITHCDAQLRQAGLQHDSAKAVKFEGESTAHSDFHAHPLESVQGMLPSARAEEAGPAAPFEGESSMRAHYQAPPAEALRTALCDSGVRPSDSQNAVVQTLEFSGESTTHRDFQPHPLPMLLGAQRSHRADKDVKDLDKSAVPFKGESSMRAHYQAPPAEAFLRQTAHLPAQMHSDTLSQARFEGQSTAHSDYQAHALRSCQPMRPAHVSFDPKVRVPFEGESSMRAHYRAPSLEALRSAAYQQPGASMRGTLQCPKFEGESTSHRDFQPPPLQALLQHVAKEEGALTSAPIPFEGESSMRAHYHAPPVSQPTSSQDRPPVETLLQLLSSSERQHGDVTSNAAGQAEPTTGIKVPSLDKLRAILHEAEACCTPDQAPKIPGSWPRSEPSGSPWQPGRVPDLGGRDSSRPAGRPSGLHGVRSLSQDTVPGLSLMNMFDFSVCLGETTSL